MADLTPEERAGLRRWSGIVAPIHPLYTLDADRLAELVRERDEAVQRADRLERAIRGHLETSRSPGCGNALLRNDSRLWAALDREVPDDH